MNVPQYSDIQKTIVSKIEHLNENVAVYTFSSVDGGPLCPMRAGQYLSLMSMAQGSPTARPYSICSSPKDAREGRYQLTLEKYEGGFFPNHIHETLRVGDEVSVRGPVGSFCYDKAVDAPHLMMISGGSAITPFLSMLRAVDEGDEDFSATLLFGSTTEDEILFRDELQRLAQNPKITVVHVLSDEQKDGFEHGFISAELIKKYAPKDGEYSLFFCGSGAMYSFLDPQLPSLGLPEERLHHEMYAVPRDLAAQAEYHGDLTAVYTLTVDTEEGQQTVPCRADETVQVALERSGIRPKTLCHSGECGFCEAELIRGEVYVPQFGFSDKQEPLRRGKLHPCCSFALGDLHIRL